MELILTIIVMGLAGYGCYKIGYEDGQTDLIIQDTHEILDRIEESWN